MMCIGLPPTAGVGADGFEVGGFVGVAGFRFDGSGDGVLNATSAGLEAGSTPAYTAWRSGRCA